MDLGFYFLKVHYLYVLLFAVWLVLLHRTFRPAVLVSGAVAFSVFAYVAMMIPLQRPYALRPGADRAVNLAMAATAATGHSAFESYQVASADIEPFWRFLMKLASLGNPENVLVVYQLLPAAMMALMALSLFFGLGGTENKGDGDEVRHRRWELALIVYAVLLLNSRPQERLGEFHAFWALTFLFKPNHTLGLVLIPVFVGCWSSARSGVRTVGSGLVLALLGWVFVMDWSYVSLGVLLFPMVAHRLGQPRDAPRVARVLSLALVGALPYIVFLYYFHWGIEARVEGRVWPIPGPWQGYLDLFSFGYEQGVLFFLSLAGIYAMARRQRREDLMLLSLLGGAMTGWLLYIVAFAVGKALQPEEFYFYTRFLLSIAAGSGIFWVVTTLPRWIGAKRHDFSFALSLFLVLSLPQTISYWWNPPETDRYYAISLDPIPQEVSQLCEWIREDSSTDAVFVASANTASWITALSGRRVLLMGDYRPPKDYEKRKDLEERMLSPAREETFREAQKRYHVSHVVREKGFGDSLEFAALPWLRSVYQDQDVEVFEILGERTSR
jgi:hypothetical protein